MIAQFEQQNITNNIPDHWREFANAAAGYIKKRKSDNTKRCYKNDFDLFVRWCNANGAASLPALSEVIAMYLANLSNQGKKTSTVERRLAAIRFAHKSAGYDLVAHAECVQAVVEGIRNIKGTKTEKKAAARVWHVQSMIDQCKNDNIGGIRDRALLSITLAGGFRGSEPLSLNIEDIERVPEGYIVLLRRSKKDQAGKGKRKGIMNGKHIRCADLLREWLKKLKESGIESGPVFRPVLKNGKIEKDEEKQRLGYRSFYNLIKNYAKKSGLDETLFGTHSLRRGFVTESFEHDAKIEDTMGVTGHERYEQVLEYKEDVDIFRNNPGRLFL